MTNDQINIAIAEACGWTSRHLCLGDEGGPVRVWFKPGEDTISVLPNYVGDLNATAYLLDILTKDGWFIAITNARRWCILLEKGSHRASNFEYIDAEAETLSAVICEAFMKAKGKNEADQH